MLGTLKWQKIPVPIVIMVGAMAISANAAEDFTYENSRYEIIDESMDWEQARKYCEEQGGHLVTIGDAGEQAFINSILHAGQKKVYWLGLEFVDSDWRWVDGTPYSYVNWDTSQPDNYFGSDYYGMIYNYSMEYDGWGVRKGYWNDLGNEGDPQDNEGAIHLSDIGLICEWEQEGVTATLAQIDDSDLDEIVRGMTLDEKAAQMVQPAVYHVSQQEMKEHCYGSILSLDEALSFEEWQKEVDSYQDAALQSGTGVPFLYGQDDVHGVNYCKGAVIFPHNIGIGAANDLELTYQMGLATANEALLCHMIWNFAPCVAVSEDPRWGRTYESYGADYDRVADLGSAYASGLVDGGIVACAKHFFGDGNVVYGTGECSDVDRIIDRGDAQMSEQEIEKVLKIYEDLIDTGVQTIMVSHSSLNGTKMHENAECLGKLKNEMGFEGFVVSDWNSVQNTSASTYEQQVINCVNAGIDMLMEVERFEEARQIIVDGVMTGKIPEARVNDAVNRIIKVKREAGILDDPYFEDVDTPQTKTGSEKYRALAEQLVEESLVLLKNEDNILPLKEGTSVYMTGPAMDNGRAQCGGWTLAWNESPEEDVYGCTTILEGLKERADHFGIEIITDQSQADRADVVLVVLGEQAYAEWLGDTEDLSIYGEKALDGNRSTFLEACALNKPVVTCIVAGRQLLLEDVYDNSDSVVMCYLPGSEGQGVADVLCGEASFTGTLPSPWYSSLDQIGTDQCWHEIGWSW